MTNEERKVVKGQMIKYGFKAPDMTVTEFVEDCLPSVTPTRPTGKWIEKEDYNLDTYYECSECGADYCIEGDILIHKYCPNCGCEMTEKMTESEDEE